jgi:hypothetical protein
VREGRAHDGIFAEPDRRLQRASDQLGFTLLYAPGLPAVTVKDPPEMKAIRASLADYRALILAEDKQRYIEDYRYDITPTTDDRPFYFHATRLRDQFQVAFGRHMLFGTGLSALMSLFAISAVLVLLFIILPLAFAGQRPQRGWFGWLAYFATLGAGFMLLEVAVLQRFVLLLGHPVYSLTVTLFSLLLGTGLGSLLSRRVPDADVKRVTMYALMAAALTGVLAAMVLSPIVDFAISWPLVVRHRLAALLQIPVGVQLGVGLPGGMRLLDRSRPELVAWGWGMNGAFSVIGATAAIFIAMNWGFSVTLLAGAATYLLAAACLKLRA